MEKDSSVWFLSKEEQKALLSQPSSRYPTGKRNYIILLLMLTSGIRLSELIELKWIDLDYTSKTLALKSRNKSRAIYLADELVKKVMEWQNYLIDNLPVAPEYIFTTLKGAPLKSRYIQQMLSRYAKKANINNNVSPKILRYTYASKLYQENGDLSVLQNQLGLSSQVAIMIHNQLNNFNSESEDNPNRDETANAEIEKTKDDMRHINNKKNKLAMYAIKCVCGEIIVKNMEKCPGCNMSVDELLNRLKSNFYKVNWGIKE